MDTETALEEEWREIPGLFGMYEASSFGRIRKIKSSTPSYVGKIISTRPNHHLYDIANIYIGLKSYRMSVHRLVALAFIGPCPDGLQVNHKDGNKRNNKCENLEYVTQMENILKYRILNGRHASAKLSPNDVIRIRELISLGMSPKEISEVMDISRGQVYSIRRGASWGWL